MKIFGIDFTNKTEKQIIRAYDADGIETYSVFKTKYDRYRKGVNNITEEEAIERLKELDSQERKVMEALNIIEKTGYDLRGWFAKKDKVDVVRYENYKALYNNIHNKKDEQEIKEKNVIKIKRI